jgi:hypothetical protein
MSEIGEECSLCGRQCDPGILLDRVCPWCYKPAPPASDDVRDIIEKLAEIEHERWSGQARTALHEMTEERRLRWGRLVDIPYADLTEEMKELDRMQVREYWPLITAHVAKQTAALTAKVERMRQWANKRRFDFDDLIGLADEMASPRS